MECWVSEMRTCRNEFTMVVTHRNIQIMECGMLELWNVESTKVSYVRNGCFMSPFLYGSCQSIVCQLAFFEEIR